MRHLVELLVIITWLYGTVLAKGFWSTAVAVFLPPYAWYLVVERLMTTAGMIV